MKSCLAIVALLSLAAVPFAAQNTPAIEQAAAEAAAGRTDDAIRDYQAVLAREPENTQAMSALARLLESRGRWRRYSAGGL